MRLDPRALSPRTLIGAVGLVAALLLALAAPLSYAAFKYRERAELLSFKATLVAERITRELRINPEPLRYRSARLAEMLWLPLAERDPVRLRLISPAGEILVDTEQTLSWPVLASTAVIRVAGQRVGVVRAETSLASLVSVFAAVGLAGLGLGLAGFAAFRTLPLRVLDRALGELKTQNTLFDAALNNMSQGICMFSAEHRLVVCNQRYLEMYGLSAEQTKPGTSLLELLHQRVAQGSYPQGSSPEAYIADLLATLQRTSMWTKVTELPDGRYIAVVNRTIPDGGWVATHEDVTELRNREKALHEQYTRFDTAVNNMSHGLSMFDGERRLVVCNEGYKRIYGVPDELTRPGTNLQSILDDRRMHGLYAQDQEREVVTLLSDASEEAVPLDRIVKLSDGRSIVVKRRPMRDGGWVATHEDVTEQRRIEARIQYMAHHDALTDLPNRVLLRDRLDAALASANGDKSVAVLWLDLDRFKEVNDTLGHAVGDTLLKYVAERLRACVRSTDTVARLGGDEFAVVQTGTEQPVGATALALRIIDAVSAPYQINDHRVVIAASIGLSVSPSDASAPDELLRNADLALYRAKSEGRGTYRFFEPEMDALMHARRKLELDLRTALADDAFELHYQPIVDLDSNRIVTFEALLRWNHPERGRVSPGEFIPLAEETGLIGPIGAWALRAACAQAMQWPAHVKVAVNLSPLQFSQDGDLVQTVSDVLSSTGLEAARLELEITESVLLENTGRTLATLHRLRDLGVHIAMDDFGTGYSSLSNLRSFPFDKIKIDQSFIQGLGTDPQCLIIVQAVTALGAGLEMVTTAEGVETRDQLDWVRALGITEVQGFHIGRPKPASEVAGMLGDNSASAKQAAA